MMPHSARSAATAVICIVVALLMIGAIAGCDRDEQAQAADMPDAVDAEGTEAEVADGAAPEEAEQPGEPAAAGEDTPDAPGSATGGETSMATTVKFETNKGDFVAELYDERMPITTGNFILLIESGFYDGLTFHRVVPDFVIQGGDPDGTGMGGPGYAIPLETHDEIRHERGALSMARSQHPDSAGSQFFVCLSNNASVRNLDGGYAAFGMVTDGMDAVDQIVVGDTIKKATIVSESEHADAARKAAEAAKISTGR